MSKDSNFENMEPESRSTFKPLVDEAGFLVDQDDLPVVPALDTSNAFFRCDQAEISVCSKPNPCQFGTCKPLGGGYTCNCAYGYTGPSCEVPILEGCGITQDSDGYLQFVYDDSVFCNVTQNITGSFSLISLTDIHISSFLKLIVF